MRSTVQVRGGSMSGKSRQPVPAKIVECFPLDGPVAKLLAGHRSTAVSQENVDWADIIVYMDGGNLRRLAAMPRATEKAYCLGRWIQLERIADPYYTPRGPDLSRLVGTIVHAADVFTRWVNEKTPGKP